MLSLLIFAATVTLPQTASPVAQPASTAAKPASLVDMVAARMSAPGQAIFTRYVSQQLLPQVRADAQAEAAYRQQLHAVVAAPTLDVDAAQRLIDRRKAAEASATASIRSSAFTMIKSLPAADRKLALTAVFADARLTTPRPAPAATPAKPAKTR